MEISRENVSQIVQKVRQAPWRVQRQWIGLILLGLVAIAMVAGLYLNISVRANAAGREIQMLQSSHTDYRTKGTPLPSVVDDTRTNSDLESQLAGLTSMESMQKRAEALGFQPANPDEILYLAVQGYEPKKAVDMSQPTPVNRNQYQTVLSNSDYTESLFDWITRAFSSSSTDGGNP